MFFIFKLFHSSRIQSLKAKIKIWRRPSKQSCTIDNLSSEVLLQIFKSLDSFETVEIRPVCRKWLEIIEENRSVWRRPILPRRKDGWPVSTLELFDSKSQSTLEEVQFSLPKSRSEEYDLLVQLLERSKETLRFLSINLKDADHFGNSNSPLCKLPWKIPHLIEFKLSYGGESYSKILFRWNEFKDSNSRLGSVQDLSSLKVLWGWEFPILFESHLHLLNNLTSLSMLRALKSSEWRRILEVPSKTLKHLRMLTARVSSDPDSDQLSTLRFPRLRVLETWSTEAFILPTWLDIPTTSPLIISELDFPLYLPSVSILCIPNLSGIQGLKSRCPLLVELEVGNRGFRTLVETFPALVNDLILILKERNQQSEEGFEVDGVKKIPLKRLIIPFKELKAREIKDLKGLVEEVLDLKSACPFFVMEV